MKIIKKIYVTFPGVCFFFQNILKIQNINPSSEILYYFSVIQ